ncbi:copper resistance protein NlpE N-terminal domain-containing protein [Joostella sp.]|uniref:copper resistance protein NlpE N-terminal domain-containing protein n=1 Tax=Joostella sp. TaxID=2231138 RepID=UPI003A907629
MMSLKVITISMLSMVLLATGCNEKAKKEEDKTTSATEETMVDSHNSENSLDWNGTYSGVLPCADCEGIETTIQLNDDKTYSIVSSYMGKEGEPHTSTGSFAWNEKGNQITLDKDANQQYFVGENTITKLDNSGNKIEGDLADKYVLNKEVMVKNEALTDKKWKLVSLMGKPVAESKKPAPEAFIMFSSEENRVSGNSGCNNFSGTYTLKEGNRFSTSEMASTRKACIDMKIESQFLGILAKADTYTIKDGVLSITKSRMAPLAVFELAE